MPSCGKVLQFSCQLDCFNSRIIADSIGIDENEDQGMLSAQLKEHRMMECLAVAVYPSIQTNLRNGVL